MAVTAYRIEAFFDAHDLSYFRRVEEDEIPSWIMFFGKTTGVMVRLLENGECVLFRSLPIAMLDEVESADKMRVLEHLMARNDQLVIGHYSGSSEVVFECSLPIENGEVTDEQLGRLLWTVSKEVRDYGPKLRAISRGKEIPIVDDEPMNQLMRRLFEGDADAHEEDS